MTDTLRLSLDQLIVSRMLIQANSGGGKSHMIRYLAETYHGEVQQIIIDREGEFSTLREKFEYLLVGPGGDIAADIRSAKLLARKLMELRLSAIIDLSDMSPFQQKAYVQAFIEAINHLHRPLWHDCLIIIDEAHMFAPEKGKGQSAATETIATLLSTGRKRGYCAILATQRLAKLDKDCAAECLNKLIGRTSNEDARRAAEELNQGKDARLSLRNLEYDFWGYGPAIAREPILVRAGKNITSPPKRGSARRAPPAPQAAIQKVLAELADLPKEAEEEAELVPNLRREIAQLQREVRAKTVVAVDEDAVRRAVENEAKRWQKATRDAFQNIHRELKSMPGVLGSVIDNIQRVLTVSAGDVNMPASEPMRMSFPKGSREAIEARHPLAQLAQTQLAHWDRPNEAGRSSIEQKILNSIAALNLLGIDPVPKGNAAFFAGYTVNGHFNNTLGKMRSSGLIDYPQGGYLALTPEGSAQAKPDLHPIKTLEQLHDVWRAKFSGIKLKMLNVAIDHYPTALDKVRFADEANYEISGHFNNMLGSLRSMGLITKRGPIKATELLFPPGLK